MACCKDYLDYLKDQLSGLRGDVFFKHMFGDYMMFYNNIPILLICDDVTYVRQFPVLSDMFLEDAETAYPYNGSSLHYVLDIDDGEFLKEVVMKVYQYRFDNKR